MDIMLTRATALRGLLIGFAGWQMSIHCPACRLVVQLRCADIDGTLPGLTVGEVVARLRCSRCGGRPSSVVLADGAPGMGRAVVRHVELFGPR
jgi:hypothetical protein